MDNNLKQLKILAEVFDTDKIITSDEIEQVLKGILSIMNSFKKGNEELNSETRQVANDLLQKTLAEYDAIKESVSQETLQAGVKVATEFDSKIGEIKGLMEEVKSMKPKDGVNPQPSDVVPLVLAQIKLPEYKETVLDDRDAIVQKINTGTKKDPKIEFTQIEGTDKFHTDLLNRAIEILDSRTKFLVNKNVKHDSTLSGSGTDADPLTVVDGGTYTLPTASAGTLGGVKIGARLTMTGDTLSADVQAGGAVSSVVAGNNIDVDSTDPANPIVSVETLTLADISDVTASITELNYIDGVTSAIQTQLNTKAPTTAPTFATSITGSYLTASEMLITDGSKNIVSAAVATYPSLTELSYVKGVTSTIQTQLGLKSTESKTETLTNKTLDAVGTGNSITNVKSMGVFVPLSLGQSINFGETLYADSIGTGSTESGLGFVIPFTGVIRNLYVSFPSNTLNGSVVFTIMKNGVATAVTCTRTSGSSATVSDTSNSASVTAGDRLTLRGVAAGSSGSAPFYFSFLIG